MVIGAELRFDEADNRCFGCSPHNEQGLQLTFTHVAPSTVEGRYTAGAHTCGQPGVIHGGVQATLLDEAIGFAVHAHEDPDGSGTVRLAPIVTVDFALRYRRPAPTEVELVLRGEVLRVEDRDYHCAATISSTDGEVLTTATARWKRLDAR